MYNRAQFIVSPLSLMMPAGYIVQGSKVSFHLCYNSTTVCSNMYPKHDRTFSTTAQQLLCSNMYPKHDRTFTTTAQQYVQTCTPNMTGLSLQQHNGMFKHVPKTRQDLHYNSTTVCSNMYPKHDRTFTTTAQWYVQTCTQNTTGPSLQQHNSMFKHVPQT